MKYLVQWKKFMAKYDSWEKKENLKNTKKVVVEFKRRMNVEVRRQERLEIVEEKDFRRRRELLKKYTAKMLYVQNDGKFENKYLKRLERNQEKWKRKDKTIWRGRISSSGSKNLKGG